MVPEIWSATEFFLILDYFLLFYHPHPFKNPENQNFENMKDMLRDIVIIHKRTTNDNYMMYGS